MVMVMEGKHSRLKVVFYLMGTVLKGAIAKIQIQKFILRERAKELGERTEG